MEDPTYEDKMLNVQPQCILVMLFSPLNLIIHQYRSYSTLPDNLLMQLSSQWLCRMELHFSKFPTWKQVFQTCTRLEYEPENEKNVIILGTRWNVWEWSRHVTRVKIRIVTKQNQTILKQPPQISHINRFPQMQYTQMKRWVIQWTNLKSYHGHQKLPDSSNFKPNYPLRPQKLFPTAACIGCIFLWRFSYPD